MKLAIKLRKPTHRMSDANYDPRYLEGIEHFNVCDFYEAHEVWEELWADYQGPSRKFFQGLIQVAVCLHHFGNGNTRGAKKLYHSSRGYLAEYRPAHLGVDLEKLFAELEACCREILESPEEFPNVEIVPDLIPEIHLDA
jgi:predicted metal-dependent hydrolase